MRNFKLNVLALAVVLIVSVGFTSYSYKRDKNEITLTSFIKDGSWKLVKSEWNNKVANLDYSSFALELKSSNNYKKVDIFNNSFTGNWKLKEVKKTKFLVLDEGTPIEETYKILAQDIKKGIIEIEKLNSMSGLSNFILTLKKENK